MSKTQVFAAKPGSPVPSPSRSERAGEDETMPPVLNCQISVPSRPDSGLMDRSNVLAINVLERYGVRVYVYPGMTHVKAAIYDGWACIGTANFDKLSFKINKEVNIGTSDPRIVAELKQKVFEVDFAVSQEVTTRQPVYVADHIYEKIVDVVL